MGGWCASACRPSGRRVDYIRYHYPALGTGSELAVPRRSASRAPPISVPVTCCCGDVVQGLAAAGNHRLRSDHGKAALSPSDDSVSTQRVPSERVPSQPRSSSITAWPFDGDWRSLPRGRGNTHHLARFVRRKGSAGLARSSENECTRKYSRATDGDSLVRTALQSPLCGKAVRSREASACTARA